MRALVNRRALVAIAAVVACVLLAIWLISPEALSFSDGQNQAANGREGKESPSPGATTTSSSNGAGAQAGKPAHNENLTEARDLHQGAADGADLTQAARVSGAAPSHAETVPEARPAGQEPAQAESPDGSSGDQVAPGDTQQCVVTISGIVVDSAGSPVANAGIAVAVAYDDLRRRTADGVGLLIAPTSRSKPDGTFRFRFKYLAPSGQSATALLLDATRAIGFGSGDTQEFVARDGRELTGVRLVVPDVGTIRGRVVDAEGQPVARIKVRATSAARNAHVMTTAVTGEDGRFAFASIKAGEYVLRAEGVDVFGPLEGVAVQVAADKEAVVDNDIVVQACGSLIIALSAQGKQVASQLFELYYLDRFKLYAGIRSARADADGIIKFPALPAGHVRFFVKDEGFRTTNTLSCQVAPGLEQKYGSLTLQPADG